MTSKKRDVSAILAETTNKSAKVDSNKMKIALSEAYQYASMLGVKPVEMTKSDVYRAVRGSIELNPLGVSSSAIQDLAESVFDRIQKQKPDSKMLSENTSSGAIAASSGMAGIGKRFGVNENDDDEECEGEECDDKSSVSESREDYEPNYGYWVTNDVRNYPYQMDWSKKGAVKRTDTRIDASGREFWAWVNEYGQYHNEAGPAIITQNGYLAWFDDGYFHRVGGPARLWPDGYCEYFIQNQIVSEKRYWKWYDMKYGKSTVSESRDDVASYKLAAKVAKSHGDAMIYHANMAEAYKLMAKQYHKKGKKTAVAESMNRARTHRMNASKAFRMVNENTNQNDPDIMIRKIMNTHVDPRKMKAYMETAKSFVQYSPGLTPEALKEGLLALAQVFRGTRIGGQKS